MSAHNKQICVALELSEDLPDDISYVEKWHGEPVKALIIRFE
jgi:hypothetical protein